MSKRLQVLVQDVEMEQIRQTAHRHGMSVGQWVRHALREARSREPVVEASQKLEAIREASRYSFPTAEIRQMLDEIERGYQG